MLTVNQKIDVLRKMMKKEHIDVYYVPNEDDHLSDEYTASYYQCKSYLSGFSGESGCVVVTKNFAGLWTDGRYFTQAEKELKDTGITLMRMAQEGVPDALDFIVDQTPKNGILGFDGRVVSAKVAIELSRKLAKKNAKIHMNEDLVGAIWASARPSLPKDKIYVLPKKYVGEDAEERIARTRAVMKEKGVDALLLCELEDPCWLLNIRCNDIPCTPVAYAYCLLTKTKVFYYCDKDKLSAKVKTYFDEHHITVRNYETLGKDLSTFKKKLLWVDLKKLNASLYAKLDASNQILSEPSVISKFRGIKNPVEIRNTTNAHVKDAVAMVRFIRWVKEAVKNQKLTEVDIQDELYQLREQGKDYIEPSFTTICAYQGNGAMMHYTATKENCAKVSAKGFLLVDSGGTYKDGTTDITRTIALGHITNEEKMYYTKVLKGHLDLARARFLRGTNGNNLDILARRPLWDMSIDYQCGTGHGVGHVLAVHEGPHGIRWGTKRMGDNLEAGMIVTDEPGVYLPNQLGIRIENELLVKETEKNFYGQWLAFEDLTLVPYEVEAIDVKLLDDEELTQINAYHEKVYETLEKYLQENEKTWLREVTKPLHR